MVPCKVARQALNAGIMHFVQLSSISIYGAAVWIDQTTPTHPISTYGGTKLECERQLGALRQSGLMLASLRIPMVYGAGVPSKMSALARAMLRFRCVFGASSRPRRSILHISNLATAISAICSQQIPGEMPVRNQDSFELDDMADAVLQITGRSVRVLRIPDAILQVTERAVPGLYRSLFLASLIGETDNEPAYCRNPAPREHLVEVVRDVIR